MKITRKQIEDALVQEINENTTAAGLLDGKLGELQADIEEINETYGPLIPAQASETNHLATIGYVNSSISQLAANKVTYTVNGEPFPTRQKLLSAATVYHSGGEYRPKEHDYCIIIADEDAPLPWTGGQTRMEYSGTQWEFAFGIDNQPFTEEENAAIQSGITAALVDKITSPDDVPTENSASFITSGGVWSWFGAGITTLKTTSKTIIAAVNELFDSKAPLSSPTFTGTPKVPNKATSASEDGTLIATEAQVAVKANILSPVFTGTPKVPTPALAATETEVINASFLAQRFNGLRMLDGTINLLNQAPGNYLAYSVSGLTTANGWPYLSYNAVFVSILGSASLWTSENQKLIIIYDDLYNCTWIRRKNHTGDTGWRRQNSYRINDIIMTTENRNPALDYGGTWTSWGQGRVPVGYDSTQIEFNTVEKPGGSKTHALNKDEMPPHDHSYVNATGKIDNQGNRGAMSGVTGVFSSAGLTGAAYAATDFQIPQTVYFDLYAGGFRINNTGGGVAHNNLQPYSVVFFFKKTAE